MSFDYVERRVTDAPSSILKEERRKGIDVPQSGSTCKLGDTITPDHSTYFGPWGRYNSMVMDANTGEDWFIVRNALTHTKLGCYECGGYLTKGQADAVINALNKYDCLNPPK